MAERLENTMQKGIATVHHRGKEVDIELPSWFSGAGEKLFNEQELVEHCKEHNILLPMLQAGFAQALIDIRATARPKDLPPEEKGGAPRPQEIEQASAQERVDSYKPEPRQPAGKSDEQKAAELLSKLSPAQIENLKAQGLI